MPRARRLRVGTGLLPGVFLGVITLGVTLHYRVTMGRIEGLEAQAARRLERSGVRVASTARMVDSTRSQPNPLPPDSADRSASPSAPDRTTQQTPPSGVQRPAGAEPDLPWRHAGLCVEAAEPGADGVRARYLGMFVPTPAWHTTLYVHPGAPAWPLAVVRDNLEAINNSATKEIGLPSKPPLIYLHSTVASLRENSCVSDHAVAYYDGAIHLAGVESDAELSSIQRGPPSWKTPERDLLKSLRHEYAHHVLVSNGIGRPIWFQEGTAMHFAGDGPVHSYSLWHEHPIDVADMVGSFPKTASVEVATAFYANAHVMTDFLGRLCLARVNCRPAELADALISGSASPETLFDWTTARRGSDLTHTANRSLWEDYVAHQNFPPATYQALLQRAKLPPSGG